MPESTGESSGKGRSCRSGSSRRAPYKSNEGTGSRPPRPDPSAHPRSSPSAAISSVAGACVRRPRAECGWLGVRRAAPRARTARMQRAARGRRRGKSPAVRAGRPTRPPIRSTPDASAPAGIEALEQVAVYIGREINLGHGAVIAYDQLHVTIGIPKLLEHADGSASGHVADPGRRFIADAVPVVIGVNQRGVKNIRNLVIPAAEEIVEEDSVPHSRGKDSVVQPVQSIGENGLAVDHGAI